MKKRVKERYCSVCNRPLQKEETQLNKSQIGPVTAKSQKHSTTVKAHWQCFEMSIWNKHIELVDKQYKKRVGL